MSRSASFSQTHSAAAVHPSSPFFASSLKQRKTMSITQTYYLAHKARGKLSSEAARPDHNLRLLVGHANLLDSLMMELADAEREQESWFNQSVRGATKAQQQDRHVQWADTVVEEPEEDWQAEDADSDSSSDSGSDYDAEEDDDVEMADAVALRRVPSNNTTTTHILITPPTSDEEDEELDDDEEEDYAKLTLTRSPSHSASSPPELDHDLDSSEDEAMPPSPPSTVMPTFSASGKQQQQQQQQQEDMTTEKSFYDDGYYLPPRNPARLVSAISVY